MTAWSNPIEDMLDTPLSGYWFERLARHFDDSYAGVRISKFPEDLRVYEHLIWNTRANVVVELGTQFGGSALWFRDRLRTAAQYGRVGDVRVISVDVDLSAARPALEAADSSWSSTITLVEGEVQDPELAGEVARHLPEGARCLVVEDTAHTYETTWAALEGFSRFVPPGGFFVVEDGCVDIEAMRPSPDWPRGVLPAIHDWLGTEAGSRFRVRRDLELYGVSCHPQGFLERRP